MQSAHRLRANIFELQDLEIRRLLASASLGANNTLVIVGSGASEVIEVNQLTNGLVAVTGDADRFAPGSGAGEFNKITIDGVGGNDLITIFGGVTYTSSTIRGGSGNDFITGGSGADQIVGDGGIDGANYSGRPATSPLRISLDLAANDGRSSGEGDNVQTEEVFGGAGNDTITGNAGDNFLAGGGGADSISGFGGNDEIVGSVGSDKLFGNEGDDALYAKNNDVDTVNGGTGPGTSDFDLAEVDGVDVAGAASATASLSGLLALAGPVLQAEGIDASQLDTSYGGNDTGKNNGPDFNWDAITAAAVDSQGRVIIVGYDFRTNGFGYGSDDMVAVRYNADGTFDDTFAGDGEAEIDFSLNGDGYADDDRALGVTTDADGNIIIVGTSTPETEGRFDTDYALVRLNEDGSVDGGVGLKRRYGFDDILTPATDQAEEEAVDAVVQADGKIVIAGTSGIGASLIAVLRVDGTTGNLDLPFGDFDDGHALVLSGPSRASSVALQTLGSDNGAQRVVVGGGLAGDFLVARLTADGSVDSTFAGDGIFTADLNEGSEDVLNDVAVNSQNEIVAVGQTYFPIGLQLLDPTPNFSAQGAVLYLAADGSSSDTEVTDGVASFNAVAFEGDGLVYIAGSDGQDFILTRYVLPLALDTGFTEGGIVFTDFTAPDDFEWLDVALGLGVIDGKVIVGGRTDTCGDGCLETAVARYGVVTDPEIEGFLNFNDVQNSNGNRSSSASFYLKSSHLDDDGNAIVNLTNNNDVVVIERVGDLVLLTFNGLSVPYDPSTTNSIIINGGNGNDVITATDDVTIPLIINGGNGNDQLGGGGGDDVIDGGNGNDVVTGGAGNDVLLGGGNGNDNINGNAGLDILIGGNGGDNLNGGGDDDIVIGGSTAHDNNLAALKSLSAEWSSGDPDRISHLTNGGGLNGTNVLRVAPGATVFDDGTRDSMTGGSGNDWAFRRNTGSANARDLLLDTIEILTNV